MLLFTGYLLLFFISLCYFIQFVIHFVMLINLDEWYQRGIVFKYFSLCMSLTKSVYKKLGLELVNPLKDRS
jgi:hypothetical protein